VEVDYLDLAEVDLPPVMPAGEHPAVARFAARIDAADAFVVVTPEYDHGSPAPLKHAIDAAYGAWNARPVPLVSSGGVSGGLRAAEHLRGVFAELGAPTIRDTVCFH